MVDYAEFRILLVEDSPTSALLTNRWLEDGLRRPFVLHTAAELSSALAVLQQASSVHGQNRELASEYGRLALELGQVKVASQVLAARVEASAIRSDRSMFAMRTG